MSSLKRPSLFQVRPKLKRLAESEIPDFGSGFVSLGWKETNGTKTKTKALKIHLRGKGELAGREPIPPEIGLRHLGLSGLESIKTDVLNIGECPELFNVRGGDQLQAFDGDRGICGLSFVKNGIGYGLTNAHVVRQMENGGASGLVDWLDPHAGWRADVGAPIMASQISYDRPNKEDIAVVRFSNLVNVQNYAAGPAPISIQKMDFIRTFNGTYWYFAGGSIHTCRDPEPVDIPAIVNVDGRPAPYSNFWNLKLSSGSILPGMSGSLLCRTVDGTNLACGLIFGGVRDRYVWAFSFAPLFNRIWNVLP